MIGFGPQIDEFIVSMNRSAEQTAPLAKPIFNLKTAIGSRKSAQPLDAPRKFTNWLITQKVTTPILNFLCTSIACTAFSRPTAVFRFKEALSEMKFEDATKILNGGDTAATDYVKEKTKGKLAEAFKQKVTQAMDQVGAAAQYKSLVGHYTALPFVNAEQFDLDNYVVGKSLDGVFYTLAQEEQKIRTDPVARVTDLLKDVFAK